MHTSSDTTTSKPSFSTVSGTLAAGIAASLIGTFAYNKLQKEQGLAQQNPLLNSLRALGRIGNTSAVAISAGIKYSTNKQALPQLLRETFESLGATYIKLGQFIASSPSLFPAEYVTEFQKCLDQTPALPYSVIEQTLTNAFDKPLTEIFSFIDHTPLASASIAQVHAATLVTGEDVVVKVQKPEVGTILHTDLGVVHTATKLLELFVPKIKFATLSGIVDEIRSRMLLEIDFVAEAQNIADFKQMLDITQNNQVVAPTVYPQASCATVLTMERFYGVSFTCMEEMKKYTADPAQALIAAMNTWFSSLMMCKSFHADLHAGNLMLLTDGRVGFIDFGIVGKLKPEVWSACIAFMTALQEMNYPEMAQNMLQMGATSTKVDIAVLTTDLEKLFGSLLFSNPQQMLMEGASEMNDMLMLLVQVGERHGIHFPRDFALLMKQMLYFDRFMRVLTPNMDLFADARLNLGL